MSRFSEIDLSAYPVSDIVTEIDAEAIIASHVVKFNEIWADERAKNPSLPAIDVLNLESDPLKVDFEVGAFAESRIIGIVNDKARSVVLASARGRFLDHIAATYFGGLTRRIITPASGPSPAVMEDDETFRARIALSPESWSTAGPVGAYLFWALSASGDVLDAAVYSEDEGVTLAPRVRVVVLSRVGTGTASAELLAQVKTKLDRASLRPLGDLVVVESAVPSTYNITITLRIRPGASASVVRAAAETRVRNYANGYLRWIGDGLSGPAWLIGRRIRRDTLAAVAGGGDANIFEVLVTSPSSDVNQAHSGYTSDALANVGATDFEALAADVTAHLFAAPRLGTLTITTETASIGGY